MLRHMYINVYFLDLLVNDKHTCKSIIYSCRCLLLLHIMAYHVPMLFGLKHAY